MIQVIAVVLLLGLAGCRSSVLAPNVLPSPSSEPSGEIVPSGDDEPVLPAADEQPVDSPNVSQAIAFVSNHVLHLRATVRLESDWTYQVFMNTDANGQTGFQGFDYIARGPGLDPFGNVVRNTSPAPDQADGWGLVTGYFESTWIPERQHLRMQIPLTAMPGCYEASRIRVVFYTRQGSEMVAVDQYETNT